MNLHRATHVECNVSSHWK